MGVGLPISSGHQALVRCFDYLTDSVQMEIEMALSRRVVKRFHLKARTYLYDITSTFVVGAGEASILQYGYSRDGRADVAVPDGTKAA